MITSLVTLLIAGLVLYLIYYIAGKFLQAKPLQLVGIILGLVFLPYTLRTFGIHI